MHTHIQQSFSCTHPLIQLHAKSIFSAPSYRMYCTWQHRWQLLQCFVQQDCSWILLQGRRIETKKSELLVRQTKTWPLTLLKPHKTGFGCVWVQKKHCCLPLVVSVYVYLYHSTEHFRWQHPHRKELNPDHHWWHNQAAKWNCSPCGKGAFQQDWIIQQDCTVGQWTCRRAPVVSDSHTHAERLTVLCRGAAWFLHTPYFKMQISFHIVTSLKVNTILDISNILILHIVKKQCTSTLFSFSFLSSLYFSTLLCLLFYKTPQ